YVEAEVKAGNTLSNKNGLNVPGAVLDIPALTNKDKKDLQAGLDMGGDWIAQSFIQTANDLEETRNIIKAHKNKHTALMAKIEKPSALQHLQEIIEAADGIMLARGDLGVEIPPQDVPAAQKRVVRMAREAGKP